MENDLTLLQQSELCKIELRLGKALSEQHKIFADRLVQGASGTKAAMDAGYSEKSAKYQSVRLLRRKGIATYVTVLREQQRRLASITREWMILRNTELALKAEADKDWNAVNGFNKEISKLLDFYPAQKTVGKLEHTGSIEHTGAVGINTNYMSDEVLQEIFELKRKEASHETGSSKVH